MAGLPGNANPKSDNLRPLTELTVPHRKSRQRLRVAASVVGALVVLALAAWWGVDRGSLPAPRVLLERTLARIDPSAEAERVARLQQESRDSIAAICADKQFRKRLTDASVLGRDLEQRFAPIKQQLAEIDKVIRPVRQHAIGRVVLFLTGFGKIAESVTELHEFSSSLCNEAAGMAQQCSVLAENLAAYQQDGDTDRLTRISKESSVLSTKTGSLRKYAATCDEALTTIMSITGRTAGLLDGRNQDAADGIRKIVRPLGELHQYLVTVRLQLERDHDNLRTLAKDAAILTGSLRP